MRIDLQLADSLPPVRGARDELMQVFQNLIDNGLKYGRADSPVEVRLSRIGPDWLEVALRDHGQGLPREHLTPLTERPYRASSPRPPDPAATGLWPPIRTQQLTAHV